MKSRTIKLGICWPIWKKNPKRFHVLKTINRRRVTFSTLYTDTIIQFVCDRFFFIFMNNVISTWRTKLHFLFGLSVVLTTVTFYFNFFFLTMLHLHHYKWWVSLWAPQTVCAVKLMLVKMCDFSRETCSGSQHGENVDAVSQRHERRWCGEFVHRLKRWTTNTWPFIRQAEILF